MTELVSKIDKIEKILEEQQEEETKKKQKKFRFPFGKKTSPRQASKGYVTIITLNEGGHLNFVKQKIEEQTVIIDGIPRLATADNVWHFKKVPVIIQPTWSVEPISKEMLFRKAEENKTLTTGFKILLARLKSSAIEAKKTVSPILKWGAGLILVGVIAYALLSGGGT